MTLVRPSLADLQTIRRALPRAADVISSRNTVVNDYIAENIDREPYCTDAIVDNIYEGKDRFIRVLGNHQDASVYGLERFATKAQRDARLDVLVNGARSDKHNAIPFSMKKAGSYTADYLDIRFVDRYV